jgi:hypothetical protein
VEIFAGNEKLASAVNDLLVVGFYLVNFGYVSLALRYGDKPVDFQGAIEFLATKIGLVLLILGAMHFINLAIFNKLRKGDEQSPFLPGYTAAQPQSDYSGTHYIR